MLVFEEKGKPEHPEQGAKKVIFSACHSGKLRLIFTSPNIISTSPKNVLMSRLISQFFCNLNSLKNFTCPSGKLKTEFISPIAKSTSPGLSDTTFFACCREKPLGAKSNPRMVSMTGFEPKPHFLGGEHSHHCVIFALP